ncbi:acetyl-CoA carboxylase biotin carboxylase subunit family protein [Kitasatospora sp. NPDC056138]|uniref:ATP-grasp domain-containing protein n=1 Tax=Kitasatospora sp. NPDC056138 TaxID=3345724 RepID=UPI0035E0A4CA
METVIVLGYRKGMQDAISRRGLNAFYVVEKYKEGLAGQRFRLVRSLEDAQEVLRAVLGAQLIDVVGVVTGHEEGVFSAAVLRAALGLPGDRDFAGTLTFRDKYLQKTALPDKIARARCAYVGAAGSFEELAHELGTPFVVKPANGFGSVRTAAVASAGELAELVGSGPAGGGSSDVAFVAESFVDGPEIHADGVWEDGQLLWFSVSRYHQAPMQWSQGGILADQVLSAEQNPELFARVETLIEQSLTALAAPDSVFHLEAFDTGEELVFGECAVRIAGALAPEVIRLTHGVDLFELQLALALGEPAAGALNPVAPAEYYGYLFLRRFEGVELTQADFEERFPFVEIDFPSGGRTGAYGRAGYAIVSDPDNEQLRRLIAEIARFGELGPVGRALVLDTAKPLFDEARSAFTEEVEYLDLSEGAVAGGGATVVPVFAPERRTLEIVDALMARQPFSHVLATSESNLAFAAFLRSRYGLPGLQFDQALEATNKWRMKQRLHEAIPAADFWLSGDFLQEAGRRTYAPFVMVKPLSGSSSRGVQRLSAADAIDHLSSCEELLLVEEALEVEYELHCDGVVRDGRLLVAIPSAYDRPVLGAVGTSRASIHLPPDDPRYGCVVEAARKVTGALDIPDFVFHLELFKVGDELLFGEIGLRPAGGGVAESLRHFYGVDIWSEFVRLQLDRPSGLPKAPAAPLREGYRGVIGVAAGASAAGRPLWTADALRRIPGIVKVSPGNYPTELDAVPDGSCSFSHLVLFEYGSMAEVRETLAMLDGHPFAADPTGIRPSQADLAGIGRVG